MQGIKKTMSVKDVDLKSLEEKIDMLANVISDNFSLLNRKIDDNYELLKVTKKKVIDLEYYTKNEIIYKRLKSRNFPVDKKNNAEPILTIFMPVYNGEKFIARALESILMQETSYHYKIWIMDDCSTDNTNSIVKTYQELYPNTITFESSSVNQKGMMAAPKIFNRIATKYWMNFDQDDYWISTDKIERFINYFELHPECTLVSSNVLVKKSHVLSPVYIGKQRKVTFDLKSYLGELNILLQTSATMFRNVFSSEELQKINSCVGTNKHLCIVGDTFRNVFALTKGTGYFEDSIDSVYNWTENGYWSKKNLAQQNLENTEYFYESIDFFEDKDVKNLIKEAAKKNWRLTEENQRLLTNTENEILSNIKVKLDSME